MQIKDPGQLRYFLGIIFLRNNHGIFLCQKKYVLDILQETGLLESKPADIPLDTSIKLVPDEGEQLVDQSKYKRIVGKLIYLTITRPEASLCKTKDSHIGELLQGFYF